MSRNYERSAWQKLAWMRLRRLGILSALLWGANYSLPYEESELSSHLSAHQTWQGFAHWKQVDVSRVGWDDFSLIHHEGGWHVQQSGHSTRPVDPLLVTRMMGELNHLEVLEERSLRGIEAHRALGLTEVALTLRVHTRDGPARLLRIGAEHQRGSTWILPIDEKRSEVTYALRLNGRMRRALDHPPWRWADRRVSFVDPHKVSWFKSYVGEYTRGELSPYQRGRAWSMTREDETWSPTSGQGKGLLIDQAAIKTLAYTLGSLKFERFLNVNEQPKAWRPAYTFEWRDTLGEFGWLSLAKTSLRASTTPIWLARSQYGYGVMPPHLIQILSPRLDAVLSRHLLPVSSGKIKRIAYIPAPSPLVQTTPRAEYQGWILERRSAGWWSVGAHMDQPIDPAAMKQWFTLLDREALDARLEQEASTDATSAAQIIFYLYQTGSASSAMTGGDDALHEIRLHILSGGEADLIQLVRSSDRVMLSVREDHLESMLAGPK